MPRCLQAGDGLVLVFGENLGEHVDDAEVSSDGVGDLTCVAGDHRHVDAHLTQLVDGLPGLGADLVLECHGADDRVVGGEVQHGCAASLPARHVSTQRSGSTSSR